MSFRVFKKGGRAKAKAKAAHFTDKHNAGSGFGGYVPSIDNR